VDLAVDRLELDVAALVGGEQVVKGELGGGLGEAKPSDPVLVCDAPALGGPGISEALSQRERLEPLDGDSAILLQVLPDPDEIADGLLLGRGNAPSEVRMR
jgi:hypothetical protein